MKALFKISYYALTLMVFVLGTFFVLLHFDLLPGYEIRIVQSGSMEPVISVGSVVLIKPANQYLVGDIVTFGDDGRNSLPTTHRIIGDSLIDGELAYITKGDANEESDIQPVRRDDIRGKVLLTVPYLGFLLDFARQPLGFVLLILFPALLLVFDEVSTLIGEWRSRKRGLTKETL